MLYKIIKHSRIGKILPTSLKVMVIKIFMSDFLLSIKLIFSNDYILCSWYEREEGNFGDDLNPWILERISGKKIINSRRIINFRGELEYLFIGSIIGDYGNHAMHIMGSGLIRADKKINYSKKSSFLWVRGPLTREKLIESGYSCPEVYLDPALLLPLIYVPLKKELFKLGVIPHYVDKDHPLIEKLRKHDQCIIIDVESPVEDVINYINCCCKVVSSSLHGIIVADAYGIPSKWIELSNKVIGEGFKFRDYFMSVERDNLEPFGVNEDSTYDDLIRLFEDSEKPVFNYSKVLESMPQVFEQFSESAMSILTKETYNNNR